MSNTGYEEEFVEVEEKVKNFKTKVWYFILCGICFGIGVVFLIVSAVLELTVKVKDVLESLGWNFVASAIISFIFSFTLNVEHKNKNNLMLKKIKDAVVSELKDVPGLLPRYTNEEQLKFQVQQMIKRSQNNGEFYIDVMGVSLSRFFYEQIEPLIELFKKGADNKVLGNDKCTIRFIIQKPDDNILNIISLAEGKNVGILKEKIIATVNKIKELEELLKSKKKHARIELRMNDDCPTQTITRINDAIFVQVRPVKRMARIEGAKPFFNCYDRDREEAQFKYMLGYFDAVWCDSEASGSEESNG